MTSQEAKEILLRYRPGTMDERDAEVRAALEQAGRDPDLAAWLEAHRGFQQGLRDAFRTLEVPAGLREQILAEKRARFTLWRSPRRLAVGALAVALLGIGFFLWMRPGQDAEAQFATFRARMVKTALRGYAMEVETRDMATIRAHLASRQAQVDWQSPPGLAAVPLLGCATLTWRSQPAAMICYGSGEQPELWLFVVDSASLPDPPAVQDPEFARVNRLNTVSWSARGRTYVLAGTLGQAELMAMLGGPG